MQNIEIYPKDYSNMDLRNEKKLVFLESENYMINFFKFLGFKEIFNKRNINSIYFETFNFKDLRDTIDGEKYRSKLRMRWYGETFGDKITPILENKIKINNQNFKVKQKLNEVSFFNEISAYKVQNLIKDSNIFEKNIQFQFKVRRPNILISYIRRYFVYNDIRITLDTNLKSKNFYRSKKINKIQFASKKKFSIMEMKYKDAGFEDVKKITSKIKNRVKKFSKYEYSLVGH